MKSILICPVFRILAMFLFNFYVVFRRARIIHLVKELSTDRTRGTWFQSVALRTIQFLIQWILWLKRPEC